METLPGTSCRLAFVLVLITIAVGACNSDTNATDADASDAGDGGDSDSDTEDEYCPHHCVQEGLCELAGGEMLDDGFCPGEQECCAWEPDTDNTTGGVFGTVRDWGSTAMGGLLVEAFELETSTLAGEDEADDDGHYEIELPSGLYRLEASGWNISGSAWGVPISAGVWVEVDIVVGDVD